MFRTYCNPDVINFRNMSSLNALVHLNETNTVECVNGTEACSSAPCNQHSVWQGASLAYHSLAWRGMLVVNRSPFQASDVDAHQNGHVRQWPRSPILPSAVQPLELRHEMPDCLVMVVPSRERGGEQGGGGAKQRGGDSNWKGSGKRETGEREGGRRAAIHFLESLNPNWARQ